MGRSPMTIIGACHVPAPYVTAWSPRATNARRFFRSGSPGPFGRAEGCSFSNCGVGGLDSVEYGAGRARAKMSLKLRLRSTRGVGYGGGRPMWRFEALAGRVGATMTRY